MNESQHILHVISPVPEGGDSELVESYRPVSVLLVVAKVFERMMSGPPYVKSFTKIQTLCYHLNPFSIHQLYSLVHPVYNVLV